MITCGGRRSEFGFQGAAAPTSGTLDPHGGARRATPLSVWHYGPTLLGSGPALYLHSINKLDELLALYPAMTTLQLREGHRKAAHLAHGWYQRVRRSCEAIISLERFGYGPEAAPIRRTIIEHTVALKWLSEQGDRVLDVMALEHAARAKRIKETTSLLPDRRSNCSAPRRGGCASRLSLAAKVRVVLLFPARAGVSPRRVRCSSGERPVTD